MSSTSTDTKATESPAARLYTLGRGAASSLRLSLQHHLLTARQGWLLEPSVRKYIQSKSDVHILDMATGNGIWAIEIARQHPQAQVSALDVSSNQYPVSWSVPDNVTFGLHNMLDQVPEHLTGRFDVIHIRFLRMSCPTLEHEDVLSRVMQMLKPGGWLQWDELQEDILCSIGTDLKRTEDTLPLCRYGMDRGMWRPVSDVKNMDQWLKTSGYQNVVQIDPPFVKHLLKSDTDNACCAAAEFADGMRSRLDPEVATEYDELTAQLQQHATAGQPIGINYTVSVGQKPEV